MSPRRHGFGRHARGALVSIAATAMLVACGSPAAGQAPAPTEYVLAFPEPHQHWMQVEATFHDLSPDVPLQLRMSRTSPGRYALHEFARNVYDVRASGAARQPLAVTRVGPHRWDVTGHDGLVTVAYKVYGNRLDGTYLAVDGTHAHLNMPAALMWARGLDDRSARVTLRQPAGRQWRVATQLFSTADPLVFTAPNLQYLMDSPIEFGNFELRQFEVPPIGEGPAAVVRVAMHHQGSSGDLDQYVRRVERIVREQQAMLGELPAFDPGHFTFIVDYLPWAHGDGMEHRNSAVITSPSSIALGGARLLDTVAHEFFHVWNVERIRPRSLEPFDFDEAAASHDLWLAEGFTSYVEELTMLRAGLTPLDEALARLAAPLNQVLVGSAARLRPAAEMSVMAALVDGARAADPTNLDVTYISYYTYGAALGLGLDLELRSRSNGAVSLEDYFRGMWARFGPSDGAPPGKVARPYTAADAEAVLGDVSGDTDLARTFFARHVWGREPMGYARLLEAAGLVLRQAAPGAAWLGTLRFEPAASGLRVAAPADFDSPAHRAGLAADDVLESIEGRTIADAAELAATLRARAPGDAIAIVVRRRGERVTLRGTLAADPRLELVTMESTGATPSAAQRALREAWLASKVAIPRS
jgi:predicted metalloprotease with PDZ domain